MSHRSKEVDRLIADNVKIVGSLNRFLSTTISVVVVLYHLGVVRLMIAVKPYRSNPLEDFVSIGLPSPEDKKWRSHFLRLALIFFWIHSVPTPPIPLTKLLLDWWKKRLMRVLGQDIRQWEYTFVNLGLYLFCFCGMTKWSENCELVSFSPVVSDSIRIRTLWTGRRSKSGLHLLNLFAQTYLTPQHRALTEQQ